MPIWLTVLMMIGFGAIILAVNGLARLRYPGTGRFDEAIRTGIIAVTLVLCALAVMAITESYR